ncbi:MAG: TolC family protein [Ignavibacteriae bacterium]|nr:TolC family protein [Ignavibacteriota bacterium]
MSKNFLFRLIIGLIASGQFANAQTEIQLSLQTCVQEAWQHNHSLKASRAKVLASEAKASEAFSTLLPQVKFTSKFAQLSEVDPFGVTVPGLGSLTLFPSIDHSYSARVSLQQPIFTGFRLLNNAEAAELNAVATQEDFIRDERDLILDVKKAYWNLVRARQMEEVLMQTVAQVSEHLRDVQNFSRQGLATENEVYKVEVQLAEVKLKLIESESNRRLANMALNNLMGKSLQTKIVPSDNPESISAVETPEAASELLQTARQNRPELKATRARKELSEAGVSTARGGWYPQVTLTAGYDYAKPNQRIIPPTDRWEGTWDVGVTVQWNVWDWLTTSHQVSQAEASVQQADAALLQLENAVEMQVMQQYWKVQESQQKQAVAKKGLEQASENYRITNEKYKSGIGTNTDVLDAEVAMLQARLNYLQANIDYQLAQAALKHAAGISNDASSE